MPVDVAGAIAGLDALSARLDEATKDCVAAVAHLYQAKAMANAPVGRLGNSTNPSGDLRRSIHVEGPTGGDGTYAARVGPTVTTVRPGPGGSVLNYGRQREFGGVITPRVSPLLRFKIDGNWFSKASVSQHGSFYLTRARAEANPDSVIDAILAEAVEGA